jgi:outer membrane protein assembly factor BamB
MLIPIKGKPQTFSGEFSENKPSISWIFSSHQPFYASPLIHNNVIYIGGTDSIFRAINLHNGHEIWRYACEGQIRSTACLNGEIILFCTGTGELICLKTDGSLQWMFNAGNETPYDFADYHQSSPVLSNEIIYWGSGSGAFYAIKAASGELVWKFETGSHVHTTAAIDQDAVYFGSFNGYVYALNLKDGHLRWKFKTVGHQYFPKGEVQGSPVIIGNKVIIGARDYNLYALDKEKGYCHWNKAYTLGWVLSASIYDSTLFIAGADERILSAINPLDGSYLWKNRMELLMFGKPAFRDETLFIGTTIGKLHAVNIHTGKEIWVFNTPSYEKNRLRYFKPDDSYRDDIYSIITSDIHFLKVEEELGGFFSSPALSQDRLIASSADGNIYCISLGTE